MEAGYGEVSTKASGSTFDRNKLMGKKSSAQTTILNG
jgi:hypothetical protein